MRRLNQPLSPVIILLSLLVSTPYVHAADDEQGRALWVAADQYVRIVPVEEGAGDNDHPVTLSAKELRRVLAAVQVREKKSFLKVGAKEPISAFSAGMVGVLAKSLATGLAEAGPDEDLVFLLQGQYTELAFLRNVHAVGARVFYRDGELHLLFGDVLRSVAANSSTQYDVRGLGEDTSDQRTHPYKVGQRSRQRAPGWEAVEVAGMTLYRAGADEKPRTDWLVINMEEALARLPTLKQKKASESETDDFEDSDDSEEEVVSNKEESRQMRLEMARMRQEIRELKDAPHDGAAKDVEHRMKVLNVLREQDLITEEEFQKKRAEILEAL